FDCDCLSLHAKCTSQRCHPCLLIYSTIASLYPLSLHDALPIFIELQYEQPADLERIKSELGQAGYTDAVVQSFGATTDVLIRLAGDDPQLGSQVADALRKIDAASRFELRRVEFVGPQVGEELRDQGGLAMLLALGGILLYLAFRFQWKFGVGAVASLAHDVVITLGVLAFFQIPFDLTVLAAVL